MKELQIRVLLVIVTAIMMNMYFIGGEGSINAQAVSTASTVQQP